MVLGDPDGGCAPQPPLPQVGPGAEPATFNNQVVRIFQQHCQGCHRPGEVAPFSLLAYRDAHPWRHGRDGRPGYTCFGGPGFQSAGGLGGWAPGAPPIQIPSGVAWGIPPGVHLVMQVHYNNPGPTDEKDRTQIGIHFARPPFERRVLGIKVHNRSFWIPAGAPRHVVKAHHAVSDTQDAEAIAIHAHMHLLGKEVKVTARYPDGKTRPLLYIDDWDFNWQLRYTYKTPVRLPRGTEIKVECAYDNSSGNSRNLSSPPRSVAFGLETTDEMCEVNILATAGLLRR